MSVSWYIINADKTDQASSTLDLFTTNKQILNYQDSRSILICFTIYEYYY